MGLQEASGKWKEKESVMQADEAGGKSQWSEDFLLFNVNFIEE